MRVYISGPMTGLPDFNFPAFNEAEASLRTRGYDPVNPAKNFGGDQGRPRHEYLRKDIEDLLSCGAILLLPGWEASKGATLELAVARELGLPAWVYNGRFGTMSDLPEDPVALDPILHEPKHKPAVGTPQWVIEADEIPGTGVFAPASPRRNIEAFLSPAAFIDSVAEEEALKAGRRPVFDFSGEVDGGGYKGSMDDPAKLPLWLVPNALVYAAARALQHGARKYAANNWRRGMPWSETYSALQRHLTAWNEGEDLDQDSGLNHLDHAAACLAFLSEYVAQPHYAEFDTRFKRPEVA